MLSDQGCSAARVNNALGRGVRLGLALCKRKLHICISMSQQQSIRLAAACSHSSAHVGTFDDQLKLKHNPTVRWNEVRCTSDLALNSTLNCRHCQPYFAAIYLTPQVHDMPLKFWNSNVYQIVLQP